MKILLMADVPRDPNAGAAGTEVQTAEALRRLGHDVDEVWAPQLGRRIAHGNLHYLLELPRAYRREMRRALATKRYDVIHVNQPHGYLAAKSKPRDAVFVHRSHGLELRAERDLARWRGRERVISRVMAALLARHTRAIARYADGHIVSCSEDAEFLRQELGVEDARVAVIPQAAPEAFFVTPPPPMTPERLRRVLYVGQFAFFKAPTIVAAAMRALAEQGLRCTWVCSAGHHAAVRALLGGANVELLDWMPVERLVDVYDGHGIFLFPSLFEGFGKVFLEAMSRGLCVVATRVGGARDLIVDGESGLLVEPGDAGAIVAAAQSLLADPERATAIAREAAYVADCYSWERVAHETAAFYERLSSLR
jgi:glycosyltransferase involved in cell wall biosynthesis